VRRVFSIISHRRFVRKGRKREKPWNPCSHWGCRGDAKLPGRFEFQPQKRRKSAHAEYFPKNYTAEQMEKDILNLLKERDARKRSDRGAR